MDEQNRWQSPVLKAGLVNILVWGIKDLVGLEIGNETADTLITLGLMLVASFAAYNNPKDKKKI